MAVTDGLMIGSLVYLVLALVACFFIGGIVQARTAKVSEKAENRK